METRQLIRAAAVFAPSLHHQLILAGPAIYSSKDDRSSDLSGVLSTSGSTGALLARCNT